MNNTSLTWWSFRVMVAGLLTIALEESFYFNVRPFAITIAAIGLIGLIVAKYRFHGRMKYFLPELLTRKLPKPDSKRPCYCSMCNNVMELARMTMYSMMSGLALLFLGFCVLGFLPFIILGFIFLVLGIIWMGITNWYTITTYNDCELIAKRKAEKEEAHKLVEQAHQSPA